MVGPLRQRGCREGLNLAVREGARLLQALRCNGPNAGTRFLVVGHGVALSLVSEASNWAAACCRRPSVSSAFASSLDPALYAASGRRESDRAQGAFSLPRPARRFVAEWMALPLRHPMLKSRRAGQPYAAELTPGDF